jgi:hypothetical protein
MTARATTLSHADFKGTMDTTPFADLLQLLGSTRKTGVLGFPGRRPVGRDLPGGRRGRPRLDRHPQGEEAFFDLAGWKTARFAFRSIPA